MFGNAHLSADAVTGREAIAKLQALAAEHGDQVLDVPMRITELDVPVDSIDYYPPEAATEEYEAEQEGMWVSYAD